MSLGGIVAIKTGGVVASRVDSIVSLARVGITAAGRLVTDRLKASCRLQTNTKRIDEKSSTNERVCNHYPEKIRTHLK